MTDKPKTKRYLVTVYEGPSLVGFTPIMPTRKIMSAKQLDTLLVDYEVKGRAVNGTHYRNESGDTNLFVEELRA
jgi:hypothetical protein